MDKATINPIPVLLTLRTDWSELDLFGHVNNVAYFKYIQASRVNYWEKSGLYTHFQESNFGPMLAATSCQFKKSLYYPGNITIQAGIQFIKNTSFGIHHTIRNEKGEIAAEAEDILVMMDFNKNEKIPFPQWLRKAVEKLENKKFSTD